MGQQGRVRWWRLSQVMRRCRIVLSDEVMAPGRSGFPISHKNWHGNPAGLLLLELAATVRPVQQVPLPLVFVAAVLEPDFHLC